jgi:hypothetical protein
MAKKQSIVKETAVTVPAARTAKPKTPRVKAAQHKVVVSEPVAMPAAADVHVENPHDVIAKIAYSYWEARGRVGGAEMEDWTRAEQEYRQRASSK